MKHSIKTYLIHLLLFILTLITTTLAGAENVTGKIWFAWGFKIAPEHLLTWKDFAEGFAYSLSFLLFLTVHEFGHYFTSVYYRIKTSLPYYIPIFIPIPGMFNIGSFGALIRLREIPDSTKKFFDVGIAGPLAGFVVSVGLIVYGLISLPEPNAYIMPIHPEYHRIDVFEGKVPSEAVQEAYIVEQNMLHPKQEQSYLKVGNNLLLSILRKIVPHNEAYYPSHFELLHYPYLFVGFLTLFFTALNLLPMGQLDGGHVMYGLFGIERAGRIARITVVLLLLVGGTGFVDLTHFKETYLQLGFYMMFLVFVLNITLKFPPAYKVFVIALTLVAVQGIIFYQYPTIQPNFIWLLYAFMGVRFIGLDHPPALFEHKLDIKRKVLGWLAIAIFILTFTPSPLILVH
ncbi:MAG: site-2 protease family protein [Bacteroidia bacterium]